MTAFNPNTATDATPARGQQNYNSVPKRGAVATDKDGVLSQMLWRYLWSFASNPVGENAVNLGVTPTTYTATRNGTLLISGGTILTLPLTRVSTYNLPITTALLPMSIGDVVTIGFTSPPSVIFYPR